MNKQLRSRADLLYLFLAGWFITALVVCNLIANKFIAVDLGFLGFAHPFIISAGVLPYPITFLITDLLSEIYGKKKTNRVVLTGFAALLFTLLILWLGDQFRAIDGSPVSDSVYTAMFRNAPRVIFASMTAYLVAQLIDVQIFHFWKKRTKGKHLWLRNNGSTVLSQLVDTTLVVWVLFANVKPLEEINGMILDGWLFKVLCAAADTLLIYLLMWGIRRWLKLKVGQEVH